MNKRVEKLIEGIETQMDKLGIGGNVIVNEINTYDGFFNKVKNVYDSSEYWFEKIWVDKKKWFMHDYCLTPADSLSLNTFLKWWDDDIRAIVEYFYQPDKNDYNIVVDDDGSIFEIYAMTLKEINELNSALYEEIVEFIMYEVKEMDFYELKEKGILAEVYDINWPEETFNEYEMLAYWTVYFEPEYFDEDIAWEVGLFPFEFDGRDLLALGGCGMDLSPKLDAYQALVVSSVPKDSNFAESRGFGSTEGNRDYAKFVVGETVYNKVMDAITKNNPEITVKTYVNELEKAV